MVGFPSAFFQAWCDSLIRPSVKNSGVGFLTSPTVWGGRKARVPPSCPHALATSRLWADGVSGLAQWSSCQPPALLLPEVRARRRARLRPQHPEGSPAVCPHPLRPSLPACQAGRRWLGSEVGPSPRVISALKVEMRKFPATTDR